MTIQDIIKSLQTGSAADVDLGDWDDLSPRIRQAASPEHANTNNVAILDMKHFLSQAKNQVGEIPSRDSVDTNVIVEPDTINCLNDATCVYSFWYLKSQMVYMQMDESLLENPYQRDDTNRADTIKHVMAKSHDKWFKSHLPLIIKDLNGNYHLLKHQKLFDWYFKTLKQWYCRAAGITVFFSQFEWFADQGRYHLRSDSDFQPLIRYMIRAAQGNKDQMERAKHLRSYIDWYAGRMMLLLLHPRVVGKIYDHPVQLHPITGYCKSKYLKSKAQKPLTKTQKRLIKRYGTHHHEHIVINDNHFIRQLAFMAHAHPIISSSRKQYGTPRYLQYRYEGTQLTEDDHGHTAYIPIKMSHELSHLLNDHLGQCLANMNCVDYATSINEARQKIRSYASHGGIYTNSLFHDNKIAYYDIFKVSDHVYVFGFQFGGAEDEIDLPAVLAMKYPKGFSADVLTAQNQKWYGADKNTLLNVLDDDLDCCSSISISYKTPNMRANNAAKTKWLKNPVFRDKVSRI